MIKVNICLDADYIKSVVEDDDEMRERNSDDFSPRNFITPDGLKALGGTWLECLIDDTRVGLAHVKYESNSACGFHINIPIKNRGPNSKKIGQAFLDWVQDNRPERVYKINAKIPVIHKDTIAYAVSMGFIKEGIDAKSFMKNDNLIDRVCLGYFLEEK